MNGRDVGRGFAHRRVPLLAVLALTGCSANLLGPVRAPTTTVSGRLLLEGTPIPRGWIEAIPIEGTIGHLRSAPLAPDGSFRLEQLPVGRVAFRVVGMPPLRPADPRVGSFLGRVRQLYLIHRTITPSPTPPLEIDLADEALRYENRTVGQEPERRGNPTSSPGLDPP